MSNGTGAVSSACSQRNDLIVPPAQGFRDHEFAFQLPRRSKSCKLGHKDTFSNLSITGSVVEMRFPGAKMNFSFRYLFHVLFKAMPLKNGPAPLSPGGESLSVYPWAQTDLLYGYAATASENSVMSAPP